MVCCGWANPEDSYGEYIVQGQPEAVIPPIQQHNCRYFDISVIFIDISIFSNFSDFVFLLTLIFHHHVLSGTIFEIHFRPPHFEEGALPSHLFFQFPARVGSRLSETANGKASRYDYLRYDSEEAKVGSNQTSSTFPGKGGWAILLALFPTSLSSSRRQRGWEAVLQRQPLYYSGNFVLTSSQNEVRAAAQSLSLSMMELRVETTKFVPTAFCCCDCKALLAGSTRATATAARDTTVVG